jgi:PilZ domain-containing protein
VILRNSFALHTVRVERKHSIPLELYLKLNVFLPDQLPSLMVMQAAVRWETGQLFGVEFLHLSDAAEERLIQFLTTPHHRPDWPSQ